MEAVQNTKVVFCIYNSDNAEHLATKIGNFQKGRDELCNVNAVLSAWRGLVFVLPCALTNGP